MLFCEDKQLIFLNSFMEMAEGRMGDFNRLFDHHHHDYITDRKKLNYVHRELTSTHPKMSQNVECFFCCLCVVISASSSIVVFETSQSEGREASKIN